jgi:nucleoside-diphosphate-sugar epimerase
VDLEDVAAAAVVVLSEPGHLHATYELVGTPPLSQYEVAEAMSRVLKREVRAEREDLRPWRHRAERSSAGAQSKREAGIREYTIDSLLKMFGYYDRFGLAGNSNVLRWLLGREPVTLERFIQRTLGEHDVLH